MTDWADDPDSTAVTPVAGAPVPPAANRAEPGWYPDPWAAGQHRYWNGTDWTTHAFPDGPGSPDRYSAAVPPAAAASEYDRPTVSVTTSPWARDEPTQAYPTPEWSPPTTWNDWQRSGPSGGGEWLSEPRSSWPPTGTTLVALLLLLVLVVGGISYGATYFALRKDNPVAEATIPTVPALPTTPGSSNNPRLNPSTPSAPTTPTVPADPAAAALSQMVVNQSDVPSSVSVQPLTGGDQVSGQITLDLCNGTFASESLRSARLQVSVVDVQGDIPLSTEAVLYRNPAATAQAFTELQTTAANCPSTPVPSPVGEPTVITKFNAAPDGSWPQVTGVDRLAYDFNTTDAMGQSHHTVAVYLRRGRLLMGVYFSQPDSAQVPVTGQTAIPAIVNVFASRMAAQPASIANGG